MGVKLDRSGRHLSGKPMPVLDPVSVDAGLNGNSAIFISLGGALLTSRGGTQSRLSWISRDGTVTPITTEVRNYADPRLSPDGSRIAVVAGDQEKADIWIYDIDTKTFSRLSSVEAAASPSWTADGTHVVYAGVGDKDRYAMWSQSADGGSPAEKLMETRELASGVIVSPDSHSLLYTIYTNNSWNIFRVRLDSARVGHLYAASATAPRFSPDGKWVALSSSESGRGEVYARSFPVPSARVQISIGGAIQPTWSADGSTIFYRSRNTLMAARLKTTPTLRVVSRDTVMKDVIQLLTGSGLLGNYDVAKDGRFLGPVATKDDYQLIVVPNWLSELEQRLAANRRATR